MIFKTQRFIFLGLIMVMSYVISFPVASFAQETNDSTDQTKVERLSDSHNFLKKHYSIKGVGKVKETEAGTEIVFSEDFETRSGPDLKVYLSKLTIENLKDSTVKETSLKIGVLKSQNGRQSYLLPEGVSLSDYKSVIIHCEAFSKLWGGFDL